MNELDYYKAYKKYKRKYREELATYSTGGGKLGEEKRDKLVKQLEDIERRRHGHEIPQYELISEYIEKLNNNEVERAATIQGETVTSGMVLQLIDAEEKYLKRQDKHVENAE